MSRPINDNKELGIVSFEEKSETCDLCGRQPTIVIFVLILSVLSSPLFQNHLLELFSVEPMEPPEDGKVSFAKEIYGESFQLPQPNFTFIDNDDDDALENSDDSFYGNQNEETSDAPGMENENQVRSVKFQKAGYRDGITAGQQAVAQEGYNFGYKESVLDGYKFGVVRGVSSALAFLPDELREKLIDEQETRDKFNKLHNSVHALSTEVALKVFYGSLTTKQGEEKSGDEELGSGSGVNATTDLESYVTELSSLLDKSPKLEVKLDI